MCRCNVRTLFSSPSFAPCRKGGPGPAGQRPAGVQVPALPVVPGSSPSVYFSRCVAPCTDVKTRSVRKGERCPGAGGRAAERCGPGPDGEDGAAPAVRVQQREFECACASVSVRVCQCQCECVTAAAAPARPRASPARSARHPAYIVYRDRRRTAAVGRDPGPCVRGIGMGEPGRAPRGPRSDAAASASIQKSRARLQGRAPAPQPQVACPCARGAHTRVDGPQRGWCTPRGDAGPEL